MSEKEVERPVEKVSAKDPFCGRVSEVVGEFTQENAFDFNRMPVYGVDLDKETGSTKVVVTEYQDVDRLIQERVGDTGYIGMKKLIDLGQARPIDFADDGKHGVDISGLPDNVNDAYRAAKASAKSGADIFTKLGIKPIYNPDGTIDMAASEEAIKAAITKVFDTVKDKEKTDETK